MNLQLTKNHTVDMQITEIEANGLIALIPCYGLSYSRITPEWLMKALHKGKIQYKNILHFSLLQVFIIELNSWNLVFFLRIQ